MGSGSSDREVAGSRGHWRGRRDVDVGHRFKEMLSHSCCEGSTVRPKAGTAGEHEPRRLRVTDRREGASRQSGEDMCGDGDKMR